MDIKNLITKRLQVAFADAGFDERLAILQNSNKPELCDFQCNSAFALAKQKGENPIQIAEMILQNIRGLEELVDVSFAMPAFINFKIKDQAYNKIGNHLLQDIMCGVAKHTNPKKVLFDYGGANVAKTLHFGHLRSPIIGEGFKRLYSLMGDSVAADTHLGDWGTPLGLVMAQLDDDGVLDFYFGKSKDKKEITSTMLNDAYPKASRRKRDDELFKDKAYKFTLKLQQKQEPYFTIWKEIMDVSIRDIKSNYDKLGAHFDFWFGESTADEYVPEVLRIFKQKHLTRQSDGAIVVDVAQEGENIPLGKSDDEGKELLRNEMPPLLLQKSNGGDMYPTFELATILMRNRTGDWDQLFYVTDDRQNLHFKQCFRAAKLAEISPSDQILTHVGSGTICGLDGKPFKTRSGDTIKLEDVFKIVTSKAEEKLKQNGIEGNSKLAEQIGIGALKFSDLSNDVCKNYVIDFDKMTNFDGKTGPYIQYAMARINSILLKAGAFDENINIQTPEEKKIILEILRLAESYEICYQNKSLHTLCLATYNVASAYATLYNNIKILTEQNRARRDSLLSISKLVYKCIKLALDTLGIEIPERM